MVGEVILNVNKESKSCCSERFFQLIIIKLSSIFFEGVDERSKKKKKEKVQ